MPWLSDGLHREVAHEALSPRVTTKTTSSTVMRQVRGARIQSLQGRTNAGPKRNHQRQARVTPSVLPCKLGFGLHPRVDSVPRQVAVSQRVEQDGDADRRDR